MTQYDKPTKYRVIKKGLIKLGLDYQHAHRHDVAVCINGKKTMVPRDSKELNKFTVGGIVEFLLKNGYKDAEVKEAFGWK
jgi:hypothetical protein